MYSEALREVKKGRNPFAQATNRASRNAKPLPEEGNGLTEDDLRAATREGLLTAVDAASESLAEVLSSVTESETKWNADTASSGVAMPKSEEHTSELQSLMRISYAVFCLKKKINNVQRLLNLRNLKRRLFTMLHS